MKFEGGRYYTYNDVVIAVHRDKLGLWGHEVRLEVPYRSDLLLRFDERGDCNGVSGGNQEPSAYNIDRTVNPQTYAAQIECVDCEECRRERKERLEAKVKHDSLAL